MVKCYSIHVRFNIPWKICFRLYIFFTHKSNVKKHKQWSKLKFLPHDLFGYTPEIWRTDTKKWFGNMYLWLQICTLYLFWGSQSFKFHEGKLPYESGILISLGMDAPIRIPNHLDQNQRCHPHHLHGSQPTDPYSQPRYPSGSSLRITGDPKITLTPRVQTNAKMSCWPGGSTDANRKF